MTTGKSRTPLEDAPGAATITVDLVSGSVLRTESLPPPSSVELPSRYRDLGVLASGGFGEVRRVHDAELDRAVAMKILHRTVTNRRTQARFLAEAKLTAGLDHPGIVAVHDWGKLADGRLWFTMREVRGRTLASVIEEVHAAEPGGTSEWSFRRLVDAFARSCQAVAYAHRRGIVHRDLKPENIMVGELGEVLVMDWGLGHRVTDLVAEADLSADSAAAPSADTPAADSADPRLTRHGDVLGTPAYMPPEQARGAVELHGFPSDVYALGAILYTVLTGYPPYEGSTVLSVLRQVLTTPPAPPKERNPSRSMPDELIAICERAMRRNISERYPDAADLARAVVEWLDGARRREQALAVVTRARGMESEIAGKRARAAERRAEARQLLEGVQPFAPVDKKYPGWALEDEAEQLDVAAALLEAEWLEALQGALTLDPELPEAHAALADHAREHLLEAERTHRRADAARHEASLRAHDRGRYAGLLRGEGALSLVTDPPGAEVFLERYELRGRRLIATPAGSLGQTPLREVPLSQGSYCLRITAPGRAEVRYPVHVERGGHWDGRAPGEDEPHPIWLPEEGALSPEEVYVPAGWSWIGGDVDASDSLPLLRVWVDAFAIGQFPVTNREYILFLNQLVAAGREEEADRYCPRALHERAQDLGEPAYDRDGAGRFVLRPMSWDGLERPWSPDWPVVLVHWHAATAFAAWSAAREGRAFRLPDEMEREKAARGADGRKFPWGNHFDANWACVVDSHPGGAVRAAVQDYPLDESPYGVRGLAGNVRDWCANLWLHEGPELASGRLLRASADPASDELRAVRGGAWAASPSQSRAAARFASRPGVPWRTTGLRLARSVPEPR
ncbi:MAG: bifunctional serine/threonine-protein kinase/formylglycine-generating enzyme family protein [Polyangiaceae bacterium]